MKLTNGELQRVLFAVNQLSSDYEPESLPQRTFDAVRSLVASDVVSFEGFGEDNYYEGPLWYAPVESVSNEMLSAMCEYVSDHPCFDGVAARRLRESVRISDYMSLPKFKRTTIYNEFFRLLGTDRQLVAGLHVSPKLTITCSLCRLQKDFTERDCLMFDLLTPHLVAAFRGARFIKRLTAEREQFQTAFDATEYGIIFVDSSVNVVNQNPVAIKLLRKYFEPTDNLPEELKRYVEHHRQLFSSAEFYFPVPVFEIKKRSSKLKIRLAFQMRTRTIILLLEEIRDSSPADLTKLGLTRRETEVLFWITQGKTDIEIGGLCVISPRTVQKHLERIYEKLGVETRTAASMRALENFH